MTTTPPSAQDPEFEELKYGFFAELYGMCLQGSQVSLMIRTADGKLHTFSFPSVDGLNGPNESLLVQRFNEMVAFLAAEKAKNDNKPSTSGSP